ncbi:MAG: pyridoxal 5'-phosphate synthase glutaminase subunit PdxT [Sporichthyaceae bacterium]|nr:pyridoxal 5'-phosphate synthase glutaminase subunit PdxT [Sporichthyaceae bacterium]
MSRPRIGVLGLQGDVREHVRALRHHGADAQVVRRPAELAEVDGLVIPGGESTTMIKLAVAFELLEPLRERIRAGLPAYGSCAGMILLADRLANPAPGQETVGGLDITVRRNAFGRQVQSFEAPVDFTGMAGPFHAVFIRAPWVESAGAAVTVLARVSDGPAAGRIVAVRQGCVLATAFHPELTGDLRVHGFFVDLVRASPATSAQEE